VNAAKPITPTYIIGPDGTVQGSVDGKVTRLPIPVKTQDEKNREKLKVDQPQTKQKVDNALFGIDQTIKLIDEIAKNPGLSKATGGTSWMGKVPGFSPRDVQAKLQTLKSKVGFGALQNMRDASKTGGALGAVSEKELDLLTNSMDSLDVGQSDAGFVKSLLNIRNEFLQKRKQIQDGYNSMYPEFSSQPTLNPTKTGGVLQEDANGNRAIVYPDGTYEEVR
jgi:hypothetical protein